jgi:4-amino-4-deoxy-L-arabinose transferase-like glycosyltransferase
LDTRPARDVPATAQAVAMHTSTTPTEAQAAAERLASGRASLRLTQVWSRHADLVLIVALTLLAGALRLWALDAIPQGVHGDEAQYGRDAQRVLDSGWIGVYTHSALGQPAGIAYVAAPGQALFGETALGARFSIAIFAVAAVPLAYGLFRLLSGRAVAAIAAFLLATSLWHIHFSRVAYQPALVPTVELAVLLLWVLGMRSGRTGWFIAAGAVLGLGLYTYNVYPIFVIAFAAWVAVYTLLFKRHELRPWAKNVAFAAVASVAVGLPLFAYMADPANDYFNHYRGYYEQYSVLKSDAYEEADFGGRIDIITGQAERFVGAYVWEGITDFVDAASPDRRPMLDVLTVVLFAGGTVYAAARWRETPHLMALILVAIIPLTTVLQTNGIYRGPLGAVPFIAFLAALPLGRAWEAAWRLRRGLRPVAYGGIALALAFIAFTNVRAYFDDWANSELFPWVYAQQISAASEYAAAHPDHPYVYFLAGRWTFNYETRQYLAPNIIGEDRSKEFGKRQDLDIDRSRPSLILLLPPYLERAGEVETMYPDATSFVKKDGDEILFIAYNLPALEPGTRGGP